jgi:NAD(P)-dependent dehydrogenase (short-subunit alcohol dehydrogenase family)
MAYSTGKSALITGAGSGIGRALALQLNREGCALYLGDVDGDGVAETVTLLERPEVPASTEQVDVSDHDAVSAWAEAVGSTTGHLDMVINNAGVGLVGTARENSLSDIQWLMGINFWGVVYGTRAFLPLLEAAPHGHLVNISSVFGLIGVPTQSAYNAAKFAVRGYTEALRQEMADSSVHVMCVHPGGISTNIALRSRSSDRNASASERDERFRAMARTSPEKAAATIIRGIERRKARLLIGLDAAYISLVSRLFPVNYPRLFPDWQKD